MKLHIEIWLKGLISAMIGGVATAISTMAVSPQTFNLQAGLGNLLKVSVVSSIIVMANYLKQSPLPQKEKK